MAMEAVTGATVASAAVWRGRVDCHRSCAKTAHKRKELFDGRPTAEPSIADGASTASAMASNGHG